MRYQEYGKEHKDVILLLHGGGLSWWNYREVAQQLQSEYRVVLPILDGHNESDRDFTTIEENAKEIIDWIDQEFDGSVLLLGGVSLGGQILLEMLSQRKDICRYAIIESALVIPSRLTHALIKPAFGSCYGLVRQKWFAKLQFSYLRIKKAFFEDYYRDTCGITKVNMIRFLEANALYGIKERLGECTAMVHIFVGEKEGAVMQKSAKRVEAAISGSVRTVLPGLYHGEFSLNHADRYVKEIKKLLL